MKSFSIKSLFKYSKHYIPTLDITITIFLEFKNGD